MMMINDISLLEQELCDFIKLHGVKDSESFNGIKSELISWFNLFVKKHRVEENKMIKSPLRHYYMDMIAASDFTAEAYHLPRLTSLVLKREMPPNLLKEIQDNFGVEDLNLMCFVFFVLSDLVNIEYLSSKTEVWSFNLFKNSPINDEMKEIESKKERYLNDTRP